MTSVGPTLPRGFRALLVPTLVSAASVVAGCSLAGPDAPAPAGEEVDESPYLDGSLDGSGDPAGMEELVLDAGDADAGDGLPGRPVDDAAGAAGPASGADGELAGAALPLDEEIRTQFGQLFLDPEADVPEAVTEQVAEYVELFHAGRARENFERWLTREGRYRGLILDELRAAGLPEELIYLAMLESGFNPTAVSRARAVGLWQFMRSTGRMSGLRIDDWVDERRDPIASTRAAIGHLKVLHDELGDWALAAAAYNAGLGRVRRAQKGSGAGYFELAAEGRLPRETRNYVPLILAAGHVARHRARYGLGSVVPDPPATFDTLEVPGRTRLSAVARVAGVPVSELSALNAHLVRGAAPPGDEYPLRVPAGTAVDGLPERLAALPLEVRILPEYRERWVTVKSGDSWWRIARAQHRSVKAVRALNPRLGEVIHPGQRILVAREIVTDAELAAAPTRSASTAASGPSGSSSDAAPSSRAGDAATATAAAPARSAAAKTGARSRDTGSPPAAGAAGSYKVRPGDTMSELAEELDVALDDLVRWNGMDAPRPLRAGEVLRVVPPPPARHRVTAGETMTGLAQRYGVALDDLVAWNGMKAARPLRTGETLVVSADGAGAGSGAGPRSLAASGGALASEAPEPSEASEPVGPAPASGAGALRHTVERGETLTSVARRYGVAISDLVRWNDLPSARPLREGEVLVVGPGGGAGAP